MFSNFLYFLVALIIYTTSELFQSDQIVAGHGFLYTFLIYTVFALICRLAFGRLERKVSVFTMERIDHLVNAYISRLSFLALVVFSIVLYQFKLNLVLSDIEFLKLMPTLKAMVFIGLFLISLIVVWNEAFTVQKRFFGSRVSKRDYISSNVSFSLPALLPWFTISIVADILGLLPWAPLKNILDTPAGEIGFIALFIVSIIIFGPLLIKKLWKCRPLEPGSSREKIERICKAAGLEYADILRWELFGGTMVTAGVMGLVARFRYILVTPALLNSLEDDELAAVMFHEIGHVQKHHMLFYLFFLIGFSACNFILFEPVMQLMQIAEPVYSLFEFFGIDWGTGYSLLIIAALVGGIVFYFRFVFGLFMRNFERQADLHVYKFIPDARPLISTFYKIASFSRQAIDKPNWHHFSIGSRIRFLEKCQANPDLINAHHKKVKKMIGGYFAVILVVLGLGYSVSYGFARPAFETFIAEKMLFMQMDIEPDNADLYALVGDYYYNKKNYKKAIDSYENVLRVDPENVHALNNLSWLFATCPEESFRNKEKALENAEKALDYKWEAFVLDTYAEALFANNDIEKAVEIAREALRVSKTKKAYYQGQVVRFQKYLSQKNT